MAKEELTPMMRQFHDMKASNPDAILLFRCGDFYETYCEDAVIASQVLGITLTKRNQKGANATTEMAVSRTMRSTTTCRDSSVPAFVWRFATNSKIRNSPRSW